MVKTLLCDGKKDLEIKKNPHMFATRRTYTYGHSILMREIRRSAISFADTTILLL